MSDLDRNKALVRRFWDHLYSHEFEAVASHFTVDAVYDDVPIPDARVVGPDAIRRKLEIGLGRVPRHVHHLHRLVAEGETVVTEHTEDWCFTDDHVVALPFVSIHELTPEGKIRLWRDYSNIDTLLSAAPQWWLEHVTTAWAAAAPATSEPPNKGAPGRSMRR
jgi:limonene-1,2-epoxide hydrolase